MPLATTIATGAMLAATHVANYMIGNGQQVSQSTASTPGGAVEGVYEYRRRMMGGVNETHRRLIGASDYWESAHTTDLLVDDVEVTRTTEDYEWDTAYSTRECCDGKFEFEIQLMEVSDYSSNYWDMTMGFMPRWVIYKDGSIVMNSCVGNLDGEGFNEYVSSSFCDGFGYTQQHGTKAAEGRGVFSTPYGSPWKVGDKVKAVLNFDTQEIEFFLNGVSQGVAFTNVGVSPMVYAVSSVAAGKMKLLSATCNGEDIGPPVCNVDEYCKLQIGDGLCHSVTNNEGCGYDGGDCCEETCQGAKCGTLWGYDCRDPRYNQYAYTCKENSKLFGDGLCHDAANNEDCGYDGGDCCETTCQGQNCGAWGYNCKDPSA